MLRAEIGQDRRDVVAANMLLTQSEGTVFWPIYDRYRAEMVEVGDTRVRLISDFLAHQNGMTQDEAKRLTEDSLELEEHRLSIRRSYVKTMSKVLSARTVARFFQIDGKLDAIVDAELAARIPLIH